MQEFQPTISAITRRLPDSLYIRLLHYKHHKQLLSFRNPERFADKIQWLKVYGHLEDYTSYVDKFDVRPYIEQKLGAEFLVPLIGVWDRFEDIDFDKLPRQFVLKATHGCGYNFICQDKSKINLPELRQTFNKWLSENFYEQEREVQYKNCKARIVCEQYLEDTSGALTDYKIWCSKGVAKIIQVDTDRFVNHHTNLLDLSWSPITYASCDTFEGTSTVPPKPKHLEELIKVAEKLSADFPFVRVDLYVANGRVYFGELTFTPGSGLVSHEPESGEVELGKFIDLDAYAAPARHRQFDTVLD